MDTATTDELAQLATTVTIPVKPGLRTTEFWLALAVIVINHLVGALRASPSPSAQLAAGIVDAVATASYAIARGLVKRGAATAVVLVLMLLDGSSCAHVPGSTQDCAAQVTPELEQTAASALLGQDYEGAVARELGGLAACLVTAAIDAAIDQARRTKLAGGVDQAAIVRHGEAWKRTHQPAGP